MRTASIWTAGLHAFSDDGVFDHVPGAVEPVASGPDMT
jgi:hypothetical protein